MNTDNNTLIGHGCQLDDPMKRIDISIPDTDRPRHTFIWGTTGVGKTRLAENLIEQDIYKGRSVVYFDPKGDQGIFTKIFELAQKTGRQRELMLVTPIYPEYSAVVDPLAYYFMPDELVGHIISGIEAGKDPFFRNVAKEITTAVVLAHIILARFEGAAKPTLNIDKVRQSIRRSELESTAKSLLEVGTPEAEDVAGMLKDIIESGQDYYNKISSSLRTCLADLSFGNVGKIIGKAHSNKFMDRLEKGERVIMIVHTGTMLTNEAGRTLGKVLLSMIQSYIGRVYMSKRQKVPHGLSIHIDEAQSLFYSGIDDMFAKGGSANVMIQAYAQSLSQIYNSIGELQARSIIDNTNTKIFMRTPDFETSKYCAQHFGTKIKLSGIYGNGTVTTRETEEDVLKANALLSLQRQEFYMMTYKGFFKGTTAQAWEPETKIEFPDAPGIVRNDEAEKNKETEKTAAA